LDGSTSAVGVSAPLDVRHTPRREVDPIAGGEVPLRQFLTRKLWDAGSSAPYGHRGDLTTLTEAIVFHGGEGRAARDAFLALSSYDRACVIEFLKSLQVLPEEAPRVIEER
jgi:hypothetical protein